MLASDVMAAARVYLNDNSQALYTNTNMVPHVKQANKDLEMKMLIFGLEVVRMANTVPINVLAGATTLTLPSDFLLPTNLYERAKGATNDPWTLMEERMWEPVSDVATIYLRFWVFRNNGIYFLGATTDREILLQYDRQLAIITGENSPEDFLLSQNYLAARTAELCARYVGMNSTFADEIKEYEVAKAEDELERALTLNAQGTPQRRPPFSIQRYQ